MTRQRLIVLTLPLIFILCMNVLIEQACCADDQNKYWRGFGSSQKEPFIKVVQTPETWNELWKRAFDKPAPAVDFEKEVVACVFLGHNADWLYSIHIGEPVRRGNAWVVEYDLVEMILELSGPFKAGGQYAMKVFDRKKDGPMVVEISRRPYKRR